MNMELARQHEGHKHVHTRLWNGKKNVAAPVKRVVMTMPEWMTKRAEFDDHMTLWRRYFGSRARLHVYVRARDFGFTVAEIEGACRMRDLCHARHIIAYELLTIFGKSLPEAWNLLGGRDHTTILNSRRRVEAMIYRGEYVPGEGAA